MVSTLLLGALVSVSIEILRGLTLPSCGLAVHERLRVISSKQGAWKIFPSIVPITVFSVIAPQAKITIPERIVPRMLKKSECKVSPRERVRRE
jgi:alcohol dehydrogenase YqhD (iron-dependent ADH family)